MLPTKVMMNVGNPDRAFDFAQVPNEGVGLARLEFIINKMIGIHPKALLNFDAQSDELKAEISERIRGYKDPIDFYVSQKSNFGHGPQPGHWLPKSGRNREKSLQTGTRDY